MKSAASQDLLNYVGCVSSISISALLSLPSHTSTPCDSLRRAAAPMAILNSLLVRYCSLKYHLLPSTPMMHCGLCATPYRALPASVPSVDTIASPLPPLQLSCRWVLGHWQTATSPLAPLSNLFPLTVQVRTAYSTRGSGPIWLTHVTCRLHSLDFSLSLFTRHCAINLARKT